MFPRASHGFTLVELVMVLVITGIMTAVVAPKLMDNSDIQARGFADQVKVSLRYAQKTAIAQHRFVCVAFTASGITLTINAAATCPGTALASADGKLTSVVAAPYGITFSPIPIDFSFGALGRPSFNVQQSISVVGVASAILIEAETGYVH
ncbi:MAG: prepilin-type N-terminal cleavage/methylation domain-containing protein [Glaciimonas sp.]|nr:prepilin-type N-terminal cleavage/methylation domain-containing protein [Glaciimonas sp.]